MYMLGAGVNLLFKCMFLTGSDGNKQDVARILSAVMHVSHRE